MNSKITLYLLSLVLCPLSIWAQQDTTIVVSEATVVSADTTLTTLQPDSAVIAEQQKALEAQKDTNAMKPDTADGFRFTTIDSVGITPVRVRNTAYERQDRGFLRDVRSEQDDDGPRDVLRTYVQRR